MENTRIPILGTSASISVNDKNYLRTFYLYGKTHKIEAVAGTAVELGDLKKTQSVCMGDGKIYHFRLTELSKP